jgi:hypothetical protein
MFCGFRHAQAGVWFREKWRIIKRDPEDEAGIRQWPAHRIDVDDLMRRRRAMADQRFSQNGIQCDIPLRDLTKDC